MNEDITKKTVKLVNIEKIVNILEKTTNDYIVLIDLDESDLINYKDLSICINNVKDNCNDNKFCKFDTILHNTVYHMLNLKFIVLIITHTFGMVRILKDSQPLCIPLNILPTLSTPLK